MPDEPGRTAGIGSGEGDASVAGGGGRPTSTAGVGGGSGGSSGGGGSAGTTPVAGADAGTGCMPNPDSANQACTEICPERCNAEDDDCDTRIDEGEAATECAVEHTSSVCDQGTCLVVECLDEFRDCDGEPGNGCETAPDDTDHCGTCGRVCALPNAAVACESGQCVVAACGMGFDDCDGDALSCETQLVSLEHCGTCGAPCGGLDQASPQCDSGSCGVKACLGNFGDCDGMPGNGCETPLDSLTHCAACNMPCNKASCLGGVCTAVTCAGSTADCDADEVDCEVDLANDVGHCGGCDRPCTFSAQTPHASLACVSRSCEAQCDAGYGDCDEDYASGCETSLTTTSNHCGGCGNNCMAMLAHAAATSCTNGTCGVVTCASGWGNCDGVAANGCEFNTSVEGPCLPDTNCVKQVSGTHEYFFCTNAVTQSEARTRCRTQARGDLVNVGSSAENAFVQMHRSGNMWLGGRDSAIEGLWRWDNNGVPFWRGLANGAAVSGRYENWPSSQPDDYMAAEDCAEIVADGTWNDIGCNTTRGFICERSPDECPSDAAKYDPGQCGCGMADTDTDSDGFADCVESCDSDPNKQVAGQCGCGMADTDTDGDGTANCNDGCPSDPTQSTACLGFAPTNFNPGPINWSAQPSSTLNCGTITVNTTDPDGSGPLVATLTNWCGTVPIPVAQTQSGGPDVVILPLRGLNLAAGNTLRLIGARPLILAVDGDVTIAGTVDANASGTTAGAGGNWSCGASQGGNGSGNSSLGAGGGAGGGFGTSGGNGGDGGSGNNGSAGATRGNANLAPLFGGCAGGAGGGCSAAGAAGGGALQITASGTLTATGTLRANGGTGQGGCGSEGGGCGGGSGGAIFLEASTLSTGGATLQVNGGNGGSGAGGPGGASGSTSASSSGGNGGNDSLDGGAGGGGGYGRIRTLDR